MVDTYADTPAMPGAGLVATASHSSKTNGKRALDTMHESSPPQKKARGPARARPQKSMVMDLTSDAEFAPGNEAPVALSKHKSSTRKAKRVEEKRLRRFRKKAPQSFAEYYHRAITQRMFVIHRERIDAPDCTHSHSPVTLGSSGPPCLSESIELAGSTGNVYTVRISHAPSCTCPNFTGGNPQCKHIVYALVKVLKAPPDLQYQLAFLSDELVRIFDNAGPLPAVENVAATDGDGRRHAVEGDCAICCEPLVSDAGEEVVWCRAACGNNLHATCFDQWAATKRRAGGAAEVTCPYCRTPWQVAGADGLRAASAKGKVGAGGFVNIATELGISSRRDYSSYHPFWVRRQIREGLIDPDDYYGAFDEGDI